MAVTTEHALRFLVFPRGQEFTFSFPISTTVEDVKTALIARWPKDAIDCNGVVLAVRSQLRLIFSGRVLEDHITIENLLHTCSDTSAAITLHVVLRAVTEEERQILQNQQQNSQAPEEESENEWEPEWGKGIHFHGCTFNEEELEQLRTVFAKKQDEQKTITFTDVHAFLRSYWKWMRTNKHKEEAEEFPMQTMMGVKQRVIGRNQRVTLDQFLRVFFLFDNRTPCDACPHGQKPRAQRATEELHKTLKPDSHFCDDIFNRVFASIDIDHDNMLTCQELELLFYMYSATVLQQV